VLPVEILRAPPGHSHSHAVPLPLPRGVTNSSLFSKKALIVDDSATNRKFVNRLLRTKIGTRDEAEDGQRAVDKVHYILHITIVALCVEYAWVCSIYALQVV
jgi:hypothetical protein